ncbi:murein hydrolase activator EnvC family protein [Frigoriflavimonas asaccharolytica]|uniref:Septal ring factor EnvC (AmiA/AmiB activator) n=1 Tax=Frigoriflavimonas asaccharolytica TaxID=2735899 RepID=A0A8J8GCE0_9FLAO|nr:peptidoglycan DD-metalloendopeptidase family protein [Frigoriflavimonas asaccharolytica]NRS93644.1 septal ring factor EnvC (AmiA/AmiB activator) [Frigoriflavimonas asaccharolytica]
MIKKISFFAALLLFILGFSQDKDKLQKQNAELKKQISAINENLSKTRSESRLSLAYLENVNKKIVLREKVYGNTQKEKRFIEDDIYLRQLEINRQNKELGVLRKNYAEVLVSAYKNKGMQNKVTFILSAKNIGQAMRRVQYLKLYSEYQDKKAAEIGKAAKLLKSSLTERQKSIKQKDILLVNQQTELSTISAEKLQKERLLQDFKKNETKLVAELKEKQIQNKRIQDQIRAIIAEEVRLAKVNEVAIKKAEAEKVRLAKVAADREKAKIDADNKARADALEKDRLAAEAEARKASELALRKAADEKKRTEEAAKVASNERDEARRVSAAKEAADAAEKSRIADAKVAAAKKAEAELENKSDIAKKAAETKAMTSYGVTSTSATNFASSKGKMSMPVYGTITHSFGRKEHPVFKGIFEENLGVKIAVSKGTQAKCIFPGVVSIISDNGDGTRAIFVVHGNYRTVYNNMKNTTVTKNQQVSAGTILGTVAEDFDGTTTLDFQIWNGTTPVDPLGWVN